MALLRDSLSLVPPDVAVRVSRHRWAML